MAARKIEADGIFGGNNFHAGAVAALLVVEVLDGGELKIDHHDFVARAAKVKTGRNHGLGDRDVLMHREFAGLGAN